MTEIFLSFIDHNNPNISFEPFIYFPQNTPNCERLSNQNPQSGIMNQGENLDTDIIMQENSPFSQKQKKTVPKRKFTHDEDVLLLKLVEKYGLIWKSIAKRMKGRTTRQCRERYKYFLEPSLNKNNWTDDEDRLLIQKFMEYGPKWSYISVFINSRSPIDLKNRYHLLKRMSAKSLTFPSEIQGSLKQINTELKAKHSSPQIQINNQDHNQSPSDLINTNKIESTYKQNIPSISNFLEISPNPSQLICFNVNKKNV